MINIPIWLLVVLCVAVLLGILFLIWFIRFLHDLGNLW